MEYAVQTVLLLPVGYTMALPVRKIIHRRGPDRIVLHTEAVRPCFVVGAVQVHPVAEHMGLSVGDIFC